MIKQFTNPEYKDRLVYTYEWTPRYQPGEIVLYGGGLLEGVDQIVEVKMIIGTTRKPEVYYVMRGKTEVPEEFIKSRLVEALDDYSIDNDMGRTIDSINN